MSIQTWIFNETTGAIPGVPGDWHAGQVVDVDMDTMIVLATRLLNAPTRLDVPIVQSESVSMQTQEPMSQQVLEASVIDLSVSQSSE